MGPPQGAPQGFGPPMGMPGMPPMGMPQGAPQGAPAIASPPAPMSGGGAPSPAGQSPTDTTQALQSLNYLVGGLSRSLQSVGVLAVLIAEKQFGVPRDQVVAMVEQAIDTRMWQTLMAAQQAQQQPPQQQFQQPQQGQQSLPYPGYPGNGQ